MNRVHALSYQTRAELFANGTPVSENDIWFGACARVWDTPVLSNDRHFRHIPGLRMIGF